MNALAAMSVPCQQAGVAKPQGLPLVLIALDQDQAGCGRIVAGGNIYPLRCPRKIVDEPCNQLLQQRHQRRVTQGKLRKPLMGTRHQPARVGSLTQMVPVVDAGDAIEHPGG